MGNNYYEQELNSQHLYQAYQTKIARVQQYLSAEINFVKEQLCPTDTVLEIAAGYGRIVKALAPHCASIEGVDISINSVAMAKRYLEGVSNAMVYQMDIHHIDIARHYDVVLCLQNGLSATKATTQTVHDILALVTDGGQAYFSSYSEKFWKDRLAWFMEQAQKGLIGELDLALSKDGVIVCKDGFRATTNSEQDFIDIAEATGYPYQIVEVDASSLFLVINKSKAPSLEK